MGRLRPQTSQKAAPGREVLFQTTGQTRCIATVFGENSRGLCHSARPIQCRWRTTRIRRSTTRRENRRLRNARGRLPSHRPVWARKAARQGSVHPAARSRAHPPRTRGCRPPHRRKPRRRARTRVRRRERRPTTAPSAGSFPADTRRSLHGSTRRGYITRQPTLGLAPITLIGQLQKRGRLDWRTTLAKNAPSVSDVLPHWQ